VPWGLRVVRRFFKKSFRFLAMSLHPRHVRRAAL
jgi:hypothetical protein